MVAKMMLQASSEHICHISIRIQVRCCGMLAPIDTQLPNLIWLHIMVCSDGSPCTRALESTDFPCLATGVHDCGDYGSELLFLCLCPLSCWPGIIVASRWLERESFLMSAWKRRMAALGIGRGLMVSEMCGVKTVSVGAFWRSGRIAECAESAGSDMRVAASGVPCSSLAETFWLKMTRDLVPLHFAPRNDDGRILRVAMQADVG